MIVLTKASANGGGAPANHGYPRTRFAPKRLIEITQKTSQTTYVIYVVDPRSVIWASFSSVLVFGTTYIKQRDQVVELPYLSD